MVILSKFGRLAVRSTRASIIGVTTSSSNSSFGSFRHLSTLVATVDSSSSSSWTVIMGADDSNKKEENNVPDIEEIMHQTALQRGQTTYQDPSTGFTVFTELSHLKRGTCCGNKCRHCPYGFENVKHKTPEMQTRVAKVRSGDHATAKAMVERILATASSKNSSSSGTTAAAAPGTTLKNVPYTRRGDGGTSQLGTGERRSKDDCNFEALGTVDELCTVVGVVHAHLEEANAEFGELPTQLLDIMSRLFDIGSHVAKPREPGTTEYNANGIGDGFDAQHIQDLESWINDMTEALPELTSFILPTGAPAAAHLHVARTVCRRAERRMVPLVIQEQTCDPNAMKYLNRLSDYFFVAARWVNFCQGQPEIQYQRENTSHHATPTSGAISATARVVDYIKTTSTII